ncbi:hypothetical protein [Thermoflexibacter ruber]|uniref:Glucosyl transferase GtrII n=1 Tax=Thermoflexibacter ruber TaxID=1003 RepID=A0A1I2IWT0_9BACT|nr:hypothetical protein [Thermoflexibacter ruber]SFF46942.1 hypothetical protein SAMN04488541_103826 [Thermoflexibacter ruber]
MKNDFLAIKKLPWTFIFLLFTNSLYLFFVLKIAFYNRLALDDYCFKAWLQEYGFFGAIHHNYTTWQGRFGSQILINLSLLLYDLIPTLLFYHIVLIGIFLFSIFKILSQFLPPRILKNWQVFTLSLLIFNSFLLTIYDFSAFYWLSASAMYFGGIAFALLGFAEIISPSKSVFSYLILSVSFLIAGSSSESFGMVLLMFLMLLLFFQIFPKLFNYTFQLLDLKGTQTAQKNKKILLAFIFCLCAFLAMIFARGTWERKSIFPEMSLIYTLYRSAKYLYYTILALTVQKSIFLLVLSVCMIYVGALCRKTNSINEHITVKILVVGIFALLLLLLIGIFPNVYAMGGIGAYRSLTHLAFYVLIFTAILSFLIGYQTTFPLQIAKTLTIFAAVSFLIMSNDLRIGLHYTRLYLESDKARMNYLLALKSKNTQGIVKVKPLYYSPYNILIMNEIKGDNAFVGKCICEAMGAEFRVEEGE